LHYLRERRGEGLDGRILFFPSGERGWFIFQRNEVIRRGGEGYHVNFNMDGTVRGEVENKGVVTESNLAYTGKWKAFSL
jgi:hypothetical protein